MEAIFIVNRTTLANVFNYLKTFQEDINMLVSEQGISIITPDTANVAYIEIFIDAKGVCKSTLLISPDPTGVREAKLKDRGETLRTSGSR